MGARGHEQQTRATSLEIYLRRDDLDIRDFSATARQATHIHGHLWTPVIYRHLSLFIIHCDSFSGLRSISQSTS